MKLNHPIPTLSLNHNTELLPHIRWAKATNGCVGYLFNSEMTNARRWAYWRENVCVRLEWR